MSFHPPSEHAPSLSKTYIFDADEQNFAEKVLENSRNQPILVDFWADWCPPCRALTPVLEKLAAEYQGRWLLAKVEADENMKLAGHYKLRGFPTVLAIRHGEVVAHFSGAKPAHWLREFIQVELGI
jgi:putative thioredoxin